MYNRVGFVTCAMVRVCVRLLALFIVFSYCACSSPNESIEFYPGNFKQAFAEARADGKKVLVLAVNSECSVCDPFISFLNTQVPTKKILSDEYIVVEARANDHDSNRFYQLTGCPGYPFPYFFDSEGNLEAFGFPETPQYDISDLKNIGYDPQQFEERFALNVDVVTYKKLVSTVMQAYLLQLENPVTPEHAQEAYRKTRESLQITKYPFNLCLAYRLAQKIGDHDQAELFLQEYLRNYTSDDDRLYGDLISSSGISM